jgi:uncharacterized protein (TIGR03437 family)
MAAALVLWAAIAGAASAAPSINNITNAASGNLPGLPNAGIAPGAIFVIFGDSLGPAALAIAPTVFQSTNLSQTSVAVTVGGTVVNALMYYTSSSQVGALLPSNTPVGAGTITVTFNNQTSPSFPITVVANNLGIFTLTSNGQGVGIVTYPDFTLVSAAKASSCGPPITPCGAANPGDALTIWATGLGAISGDDASGSGLGQDMPGIPVQVWLGGVSAPVVYRGRSGCCVGEDQIVFTVPSGVPTGCAVPLVIQIDDQISNNTVMAVANGSRDCTPADPALASVNLEQAVMAGPVTLLSIQLANNGPDKAKFQSFKVQAYTPGSQAFFSSYVDSTPLGTCLIQGAGLNSQSPAIQSFAGADLGATVTIHGPNGVQVVASAPQSIVTFDSSGSYVVAGDYTVSGTGGTDIGSFSASSTVSKLPTLISPTANQTVTVPRANGIPITWSTSGLSGNLKVLISGNNGSAGVSVVCKVPASAGAFTIPPAVTLMLPSGPGSSVVLSPEAVAVPLVAAGLTVGEFNTHQDGPSFNVTFQ